MKARRVLLVAVLIVAVLILRGVGVVQRSPMFHALRR